MRLEDKLFRRFDLYSNEIAIQYYQEGKLQYITYHELKNLINDAQARIKNIGLEPGDRIGLIGENLLEWVVAYIASVGAELTPALIDPQATVEDFQKKIKLVDPRVLFVSKAALPKVASYHLPVFNFQEGYQQENHHLVINQPRTVDADSSIAALIFTSGTTDEYKAAIITHDNICKTLDLFGTKNNFLSYEKSHYNPKYCQEMHLLDFLPWHHIFGLFSTLLLPLHTGFKLTIVDQVTPTRVVEVIKEVKPTFLFTVPRLIQAISLQITKKIEELHPKKQKIISHMRKFVLWLREKTNINIGPLLFKKIHDQFGGRLKIFVAGGAPLNIESARFLTSLGFTVLEGYGLSESTGTGFARKPLSWNKFGSVGKSIPGSKVQIVHPNEDGEGEICFKGPHVMRGYFRNEEATERTLKNGWLLTGDIGRINANGELEITGRIKEMIISSTGEKTFPEHVKMHYENIPHIKELAIIGIRLQNRTGDEIHAVVVSEDPEQNHSIHAAINQRSRDIPHHLRIQHIHFKPEILKTPTLKVKLKPLKQFILDKILQDRDPLLIMNSETETYLIDILSKIVGHNSIRIDHHFSEIALDSLGALELINEIKHRFNHELPVSLIASNPTIRSVCQHLDKKVIPTNLVDKQVIASNLSPVVFKKELKTENIFITGSTGGVGGHLVKCLLEETDATLHCLIRADSEENARSKLVDILRVYEIDTDRLNEWLLRIEFYLGDITKPLLGLDKSQYEYLTKNIDLVIHSAASIQLSGDYESVKAINVGGTSAVIELALSTSQKYMLFISSYSVMGDRLYQGAQPFLESDFDVGQRFSSQGYERSKFEAEALVRQSTKRGLNWQIMRLGNVFGQSDTGVYPLRLPQVESMFYNNIKTVLETMHGMEDHHFYDITPIDYITSAIVYLGMQYKEIYSTYHLVNSDHKQWSEVLDLIESCGYPLTRLSARDYLQKLRSRELLDQNNKTYRSITTELLKFKSDLFLLTGGSFADSSKTRRILEEKGINCPPIDKNLIEIYINYCLQTGYINSFIGCFLYLI